MKISIDECAKISKKMDEITTASNVLEYINILSELMNVYHGLVGKITAFQNLKEKCCDRLEKIEWLEIKRR